MELVALVGDCDGDVAGDCIFWSLDVQLRGREIPNVGRLAGDGDANAVEVGGACEPLRCRYFRSSLSFINNN